MQPIPYKWTWKLSLVCLLNFSASAAMAAALSEINPQEWQKVGGDDDISREYSRYKPFEMTTLTVGESQLEIFISAGKLNVTKQDILRWIANAANAVMVYHGRFPVKQLRIIVLITPGKGVHGASAFGGRLIRMPVGQDSVKNDFDTDWTMTHEILHLGFPSLTKEHEWMEEGMAVYLEPIARARAGLISIDEVWKGMIEGIPKGLPEPGDQGLERTHTWGRTYWGGTLFWLLADIEIRKQSNNKHSIDDVMHAILEAGGNGSEDWSVRNVLTSGDRSIGTHVLTDVYNSMAFKPYNPDLKELWSALGVSLQQDGRIRYDDTAPLADIRKAITATAVPEQKHE